MDTNKNDPRYQYLMAFDNYIKHIKTVLITVKNSILIVNADEFQLNAFSYGDTDYPAENALDKIKEIHDYVISTIDAILSEILLQIPNCFANTQRIQEIHYKQVYTEREGKTYTEYVSFFIDVPNNLSDLSYLFTALAIVLSDIMCFVVAYNYRDMLCGIEHAGYSAPASTAFLYAIPFVVRNG